MLRQKKKDKRKKKKDKTRNKEKVQRPVGRSQKSEASGQKILYADRMIFKNNMYHTPLLIFPYQGSVCCDIIFESQIVSLP